MGNGFTAPPKKDFDSFAGLMGQQAGHFGQLDQWAGKECSEAGDLDGLLVLPVRELAPKIASFFTQKLGRCQAGMTDVAGKARQTGQGYASTENANSSSFANLYGQPLPGFPDIGVLPGLQHLGDFTDEPLKLNEPDPAGDDTAKNIQRQLFILGFGGGGGVQGAAGLTPVQQDLGLVNPGTWLAGIGNFSGHILAMADKIFKYFTGQSLVELLIRPITGNYGRLKFLQDAYDQLGDGIYTVTGTVRKGSVRLGGEWQGDAATGFDSLMFRWSMGSGGIGDAAKIMSHVYRNGYDTICVLIQAALQAITRLINAGLKQLVEAVAGDAAIETVGGGPEDPIADIVAAIWTVYKIYQIINAVIVAVQAILKIYDDVKKAVQKLVNDVEAVIKAFQSPASLKAEVNSLLDDVRQRGFEFEKNSGWNPDLGAARIALLP
jgi:uncharacterized protein YukE